MARWKRYLEIYAFASMFPIGALFTLAGCWKLMIWSYGGKSEFRRLVIGMPYEEEWFDKNPSQVFWREAPLADIPTHITDKPKGDPEAKKEEGQW